MSDLVLGLLGFHYECPNYSDVCQCRRDVARLFVLPHLEERPLPRSAYTDVLVGALWARGEAQRGARELGVGIKVAR